MSIFIKARHFDGINIAINFILFIHIRFTSN